MVTFESLVVISKSNGHANVRWTEQKVWWYVTDTVTDTDGDEKKIVSSRHDCIIVYVGQEFKINKMAAEGYLTYWPIHFWQSEK